MPLPPLAAPPSAVESDPFGIFVPLHPTRRRKVASDAPRSGLEGRSRRWEALDARSMGAHFRKPYAYFFLNDFLRGPEAKFIQSGEVGKKLLNVSQL